jgi:hypothetical protein
MREKVTISLIENILLIIPIKSTTPNKTPINIEMYSGLNFKCFICTPFNHNYS